MPFWIWKCKRGLSRFSGGAVQAILASVPIAGLVYYLLQVTFSIIPDPIGTAPEPGFLRALFFGLGIGVAVASGIGLFAYRTKLSASRELRRKMRGIRDMFDCLDTFEEAASYQASHYSGTQPMVEDDEWNTSVGNFQLEVLRILIRTILKTESPGTAMMERASGELKITATYPSGHDADIGLVIKLVPTPDGKCPCMPEGGLGVAGHAACRGLPIYVPYAQSHWEWGVVCLPAAQPESELRFERVGPPLWKKPRRSNFRSLISAPAATLVSSVPNREWKRYAVINIEGTRRDQFDTDDIYAVAVAANVMAQGLEHSKNCEQG